MAFSGGNKAIRDHRQDGKNLLLFEDLGKGKGVRYEGLFECASWEILEGTDRDKDKRKIIVFDLVPVTTAIYDPETIELNSKPEKNLSIEALRQAAYSASNISEKPIKTSDAKKCGLMFWQGRMEFVKRVIKRRLS